jgi:hypothetical protein
LDHVLKSNLPLQDFIKGDTISLSYSNGILSNKPIFIVRDYQDDHSSKDEKLDSLLTGILEKPRKRDLKAEMKS